MRKTAAKWAPSFLFKYLQNEAGRDAGSARWRAGCCRWLGQRGVPALQTRCGRAASAPSPCPARPSCALQPWHKAPVLPMPGGTTVTSTVTLEPEPCRLAVPQRETEPSPSFFIYSAASRATKIKHLQVSNHTGPQHVPDQHAGFPETALRGGEPSAALLGQRGQAT